jgi:hypothetical protein
LYSTKSHNKVWLSLLKTKIFIRNLGDQHGCRAKVKGACLLLSIHRKKYGQPIEHWIKLVQKQKDMKHMEVVNWLKNEHGLGLGHANAIVAHCFAQKSA